MIFSSRAAIWFFMMVISWVVFSLMASCLAFSVLAAFTLAWRASDSFWSCSSLSLRSSTSSPRATTGAAQKSIPAQRRRARNRLILCFILSVPSYTFKYRPTKKRAPATPKAAPAAQKPPSIRRATSSNRTSCS